MRQLAWLITLSLSATTFAEVVESVEVEGVRFEVAASSVLEDPKVPGRYGPSKLVDTDPSTVWAEGNKHDGVGEWVELRFARPTRVLAVEVLPGHGADYSRFASNGVPLRYAIEVDGVSDGPVREHTKGELTYSIGRPRSFLYRLQRTAPVSRLRMTVKSVERGLKYRDTCIATLRPILADEKGGARGEDGLAAALRLAESRGDEWSSHLTQEFWMHRAEKVERGSKSVEETADFHFKKPKQRAAIAEAMPRTWQAILRAETVIVERPSPGKVELTGSYSYVEDGSMDTRVYASFDLEGSRMSHLYFSVDRTETSADEGEGEGEGEGDDESADSESGDPPEEP